MGWGAVGVKAEECERRGLRIQFLEKDFRKELSVKPGENVHDIRQRIVDKCRPFICPRDRRVHQSHQLSVSLTSVVVADGSIVRRCVVPGGREKPMF